MSWQMLDPELSLVMPFKYIKYILKMVKWREKYRQSSVSRVRTFSRVYVTEKAGTEG